MGYFLQKEEGTGSFICPYCGSELDGVDLNDLIFMCPECGEYIELNRNRQTVLDSVKMAGED